LTNPKKTIILEANLYIGVRRARQSPQRDTATITPNVSKKSMMATDAPVFPAESRQSNF